MSPAAHGMSESDWALFDRLKDALGPLFQRVFADPAAPRTVVVVPGLSVDPEVLANVSGVRFYEERMLSMLMLLRLPNTRVVFVTSTAIDPAIIDYTVGLLPGIPSRHAKQRLTLLDCHDASPVSLTAKILDRPRLIEKIRRAIPDPAAAHLSVFNATDWEARLACLLGIPMYACDPRLAHWGTKSGSREAFRRAGVPLPDGAERLRDLADVATAIEGMRARQPGLRRVVLKLEQGFSGDGNARVPLSHFAEGASAEAILAHLRGHLEPEAQGMTPESYAHKYEHDGGIVEEWLEGEAVASPSVQLRINLLGAVELPETAREGRLNEAPRAEKLVVGNKYDVRSVIETLGALGILETPEHPGFTTKWTSFGARQAHPSARVECDPPIAFWMAGHGANPARVAEWFGDLGVRASTTSAPRAAAVAKASVSQSRRNKRAARSTELELGDVPYFSRRVEAAGPPTGGLGFRRSRGATGAGSRAWRSSV